MKKPLIVAIWMLTIVFKVSSQQKALRDSLAQNPVTFLNAASKMFGWTQPVDPVKIVGPVYFVGTRGLASYLFTTPEGHVLLYTCMPGSGPMIAASIRKLGFKPEDIKYILTGHAHIDHVGGHAYIKKISGAKVAIMAEEKDLFESGGKTDFHYGSIKEFRFEPVPVDTVLRNGDVIKLGDIALTCLLTPGHTRGGTTWVTTVADKSEVYSLVFPDGTSINPGYRIYKNPSYPGIENNFRKTLHTLELLRPDIWLSSHTDFFDFERKRDDVVKYGINAWIDPHGYRARIAEERAKFKAQVDQEAKPKE